MSSFPKIPDIRNFPHVPVYFCFGTSKYLRKLNMSTKNSRPPTLLHYSPLIANFLKNCLCFLSSLSVLLDFRGPNLTDSNHLSWSCTLMSNKSRSDPFHHRVAKPLPPSVPRLYSRVISCCKLKQSILYYSELSECAQADLLPQYFHVISHTFSITWAAHLIPVFRIPLASKYFCWMCTHGVPIFPVQNCLHPMFICIFNECLISDLFTPFGISFPFIHAINAPFIYYVSIGVVCFFFKNISRSLIPFFQYALALWCWHWKIWSTVSSSPHNGHLLSSLCFHWYNL